MAKPQVILASASPRRRELLDQLGIIYQVLPVDISETPLHMENPDDYTRRLSTNKAMKAWERSSELPVLAADTICVLENQILGKPESLLAAQQMLARLSGKTHTVITAVSLYNGQHYQRISHSKVCFKSLSSTEITHYCQTQEPLGKAGSYAIQGYAAAFIKSISGSYSGVVGLPLYETATLLNQIGIPTIPEISQR